MLKRKIKLDHPTKYQDAIYEQRNVWVIREDEYIAFGRIVDATKESVTIVDHDTQQVEKYLRINFQFFAEVD